MNPLAESLFETLSASSRLRPDFVLLLMSARLLPLAAIPFHDALGLALPIRGALFICLLIASASTAFGHAVHIDASALPLALGRELVLGVSIAAMVAFPLAAAENLGSVIDTRLSPARGDAATRLFTYFSLATFAGLGGLRMLLGRVVHTFAALPLGQVSRTTGIDAFMEGMIQIGAACLSVSVAFAVPVLGALLVIDSALGAGTRVWGGSAGGSIGPIVVQCATLAIVMLGLVYVMEHLPSLFAYAISSLGDR